MFTFLVTQSLRNRLLVLAIAAVLVLSARSASTRLPVDVFPDLNKPTVTIMTEAEGLAPPEVEQLVTFPIETQMNGVPGVTRVRSVSGVGLSIVYVEFDWGTDIYRNRQQIAERLALMRDRSCRRTSSPQMGPISSIMGQIMLVAMTSARRRVADGGARGRRTSIVRPRLLTIPGVAQVIPIGGEVRQYRVSPNPPALRALGVTYEQVETALTSVRRQHRRRLHRPVLARISDPQHRPHHQPRRPAQPRGRAPSTAARLPATRSRRVEFARTVEARRCRLHGQARRHRLGREAARRRYGHADARDRGGARRRSRASLPNGIKADQVVFRQAELHRDLDPQRRDGAARGRRRRRDRAVRLPAELAHHGDLADRDPGLDPGDRRSSSTSSGCPSTR